VWPGTGLSNSKGRVLHATVASTAARAGLAISFLGGAEAGGEKKEVKLTGKITGKWISRFLGRDCVHDGDRGEEGQEGRVYYFDTTRHKNSMRGLQRLKQGSVTARSASRAEKHRDRQDLEFKK